MAERTNLRIDTDLARTEASPRTAEPANVLPIISAAPTALSPLAGRRIVVTVAQDQRPGEMRALADDLAFEDGAYLAGHLAALDAEVVLAPTGEAFGPEDLRAIERAPGVTAWAGAPITPPREDPAACARNLAAIADEVQADLTILHEPALAAARRDPRPLVALCCASRVVRARLASGAAPSTGALREEAALERLGLHAADRVIASSRALAAELVSLHGLTLPPVVVPPVFRKPEAHEKRSADAGLCLAGAAQCGPAEILALDRAASQICGQALLLDAGPRDPAGPLCLEQLHRLPGMTAGAADSLLLRAAAFYCPSSGPEFERLVWRAAIAGCALVLPDAAVYREFWQGAAHFVPPSAEALAAAMRRMLEDDDYRRRMAAAALRRARALATGPAIATLHKTLAAPLSLAPLTARV